MPSSPQRAAASGLLRRSDATPERLADVLVRIATGDGEVPSDLLARLLDQVGRLQRQVLAPRGLVFSGLNDRETSVLRLVADGLDTAEIATQLAYSERTVKYVLHDVTTRLQLATDHTPSPTRSVEESSDRTLWPGGNRLTSGVLGLILEEDDAMTFDHEPSERPHDHRGGEPLGASQRDIQIALMTAMQESSLQNLSGGDRDSVGLFQQRDAWGTFEQRHNPATAAAMFFQGGHEGQRGLFDFSDRNSMSLSEAARSRAGLGVPGCLCQVGHRRGADPAARRRSPAGGRRPGTGAGADPFAPDKGTHVAATDQDHDGLTDEFERLLGTDPTKADTDGDGVSDYVETTITHTDPLVADDQHGTRLVAAHDGGTPHDARIPMAALKQASAAGPLWTPTTTGCPTSPRCTTGPTPTTPTRTMTG